VALYLTSSGLTDQIVDPLFPVTAFKDTDHIVCCITVRWRDDSKPYTGNPEDDNMVWENDVRHELFFVGPNAALDFADWLNNNL
jgi:hypothetical protein